MRGDAPSRVHWPATAHAGTVMVREVDPGPRGEIVLVLVVHGNGDADEQAAGRLMWIGSTALASGFSVWLSTVEREVEKLGRDEPEQPPGSIVPSRTVSRRVLDRVDLGRRLAGVVDGVPDDPALATMQSPQLVVSSVGDQWC